MRCAEDEDDGNAVANLGQGLSRECRIVLVSGFESFNVELYKKVGMGLSCRLSHDCRYHALLLPSGELTSSYMST